MTPSSPAGPSSAATSINFVVSAIHTATFGNAIYQVVAFDSGHATLGLRTGSGFATLSCAAMAMILALRFFFGNNNFLDEIFRGSSSAGLRLYHFAVTVTQSLVLLGCSYLVRNPPSLVLWLAILFFVALLWYVGCIVVAPASVFDASGEFQQPLARNEAANVVLALGALVAWSTLDQIVWQIVVVGSLFLLNTLVDLHSNLKRYMGLP